MKGLSDTYVESVIRAFAKGKTTARQVAAKLGITRQYANRLKKAYAEEGPPCHRHGNSGRAGPTQILHANQSFKDTKTDIARHMAGQKATIRSTHYESGEVITDGRDPNDDADDARCHP